MPIIDSVECGSENTLSNEEIQELAEQMEFTIAYCMGKRESQNAREDIALRDKPPKGEHPMPRPTNNADFTAYLDAKSKELDLSEDDKQYLE